MPACTRSTRSSTSTPTPSARRRPGCAAPTATCPADIAVQWCRSCPTSFHSRASAIGRRYAYLLLESPVRPALESGLAGWTFRPLDGDAMRRGRAGAGRRARLQRLPLGRVPGAVAGEDAARASTIERRGAYWRFDFEADAFLHHMIRNIVGCLVAVGSGARAAGLARRGARRRATARSRRRPSRPTASTSSARTTMPSMRIPERTAAMDWLP